MKKWKWEVAGIETDERALQYARDTLGLKVFKGSEWDFPMESFDVITFWHALEHIHDLKGTLKSVLPLLRNDGLLLIALPNISSLDFRLYREDWVALDLPRHLYHFDPNSFRSLFYSFGLEVFKLHQMPLDVFYNCIMSEKLAFERKRRRKVSFPLSLLRGGVIALMSFCMGTLGNGSGMLYYLRKL